MIMYWKDPKDGNEFTYNWGFDIETPGPVDKAIKKILNLCSEKEKEEMNEAIKWKVQDVSISTETLSGETDIKAVLSGCINPLARAPYGSFNPAILHKALQEKLDAELVAEKTPWPKSNPNIKPSTKLPKIKKVVFNNPATIVIWSDETKTVVKACNEAYDPEKGLAMAISKKSLGNEGNYFEVLKKWLKKCDIPSDNWLATQRLHNALQDKKATKADLRLAMEEAIKYLEGHDEG